MHCRFGYSLHLKRALDSDPTKKKKSDSFFIFSEEKIEKFPFEDFYFIISILGIDEFEVKIVAKNGHF